MRVCILTTSFPLYEGIAVGIHVIGQSRHLVKLGVEVDVLAPHHQGALRQETIDGVRVRRFRYMLPERWQTLCYGAGMPTNIKNSWWARIQLPFLLTTFILNGLRFGRHCDVIQANWSVAGLAGVLLSKVLNKPVVLVMYGAEVFVLKDNPILKFIIKQSDHVIGISQYTLDKTIRVQRPRAYSLIPPGVDVNRFRKCADTAHVRRKLAQQGIDFSIPLVFALGKFIERKGFSYLIEAIAMLQKSQPVQLMIGGRGPLKGALQQQVSNLGIVDQVVFLDYISDDELPAYYTVADVCVSPSIIDLQGDTEGLGMVLLEALACETPCVASRVGGIVDIVQDGMNGLLVEPKNSADLADKIQWLINNDRLRQEMGTQGRLFVKEHFSWQVKAHEILTVYQAILGKKR
jgi:glycosyltransferase involved in cell wall biosynthesis